MKGPDRASDWLAQNTYLVAGVLAAFCIVAVGTIALYDQLLGTERWCYDWLDDAGDTQRTCRDDERSCDFVRDAHCGSDPDAAASPCRRRGTEPAAVERCAP